MPARGAHWWKVAGRCLRPACDVEGEFDLDDAVEIADDTGSVFAKGLCRYSALTLQTYKGRQTGELPAGFPDEVVHRDDLVVLPAIGDQNPPT